MNRFLNRLSLVTIVALISISCGSREDNPDIKTINDISEFPKTVDLSLMASLDDSIPSMGISDIRIVDSLLIVSVNEDMNYWHLYSLPDYNPIDSMLNVGGGPGETVMPMPVSFASLIAGKEDSQKRIGLPTVVTSKMILMDLDKSEKGNTLRLDTVVDLPVEPGSPLTFMLGEDKVFNYTILPEEKKVKREIKDIVSGQSLTSNGEIAAIDLLNSRVVDDMSQISTLMTYPMVKPDGGKVAEIPSFNNVIYLYDTNTGESGKIIYPHLKRQTHYNAMNPEKSKPTFGGGYGYDDFFTLLRYIYKDDENKEEYLDFISWDGKPLGSIKLPNSDIRRCEISLLDNKLLCLVAGEDNIVSYDISAFLDSIKI